MMAVNVDPGKLKELAQHAPYGEAARWVRENIDPLWGLDPSANAEFKVSIDVSATRRESFKGTVIVTASSEDMAKKLVGELVDAESSEINWTGESPFFDDWEFDWCDFTASPLGEKE